MQQTGDTVPEVVSRLFGKVPSAMIFSFSLTERIADTLSVLESLWE